MRLGFSRQGDARSRRGQCSVADCNRNAYRRKWCSGHYRYYLKTGYPGDLSVLTPKFLTIEERFWSKVNKRGPKRKYMRTRCWVWTANGGRYGFFGVNGKNVSAHRFAWLISGGVIPDGKELDHLCRRTLCVRPSHLEAVTHHENILRGNAGRHNKIKKKCPSGHLYVGSNLYISPSGRRICRTCQRLADKRHKARRSQ